MVGTLLDCVIWSLFVAVPKHTELLCCCAKASHFLQSSLTSSHGEIILTLDAAGRKPGQLTPSQTPYPYDQFWPRCQYGVYIAVRVV
jgi:hypothetical protein